MNADSKSKKRRAPQEVINQKKLKRSPCDLLARTTQEELEGSKHNDNHPGIQQLHRQSSLDEYICTLPFPEAVRALSMQRNYVLLDEATKQLKKMLSGPGDSNIIAPEILAHLGHREIVLLSCTTVLVGQDFASLADYKKPEDWAKEKKHNFCLKFTEYVGGRWDMEHILDRWEAFLKVSQQKARNAMQS